jgi:CheY-like chemotaxis protein
MQSSRYRVLIIDDDSNTLTLLKLLFESRGHEVALAADGATGIELVHTWHPDVIILDVAMPQLSGRDVHHYLKGNPVAAVIPLVIYSAALAPRELAYWQEQPNVAAIVIKPVDLYSLLSLVESCASQRSAYSAQDL